MNIMDDPVKKIHNHQNFLVIKDKKNWKEVINSSY